MEQHGKEAIDGLLGVGAVTAPFWVKLVETGFTIGMALGGAVLLALRIAIAWREWRAGR